MLLIQFLPLILILCVWYYFKKSKKYPGLDKIKGPKPLPLIGNVLDFGQNVTETFYDQLRLLDKYGSMVKFSIGPTLIVMLTEAEHIEKILGSSVNIDKSDRYQFFKDWLGQGLLISKGQYWRNHRKIITPAFHLKIVQEYLYFITKNAKILHDKLAQHVGEEATDVKEILKLFTLDIISEAAMSRSVNAQIDSNNDYVRATEGILTMILRRVFSIIGQSDFLYKLTSDYKKSSEYISIVKKFTRKVLDDTKREREIKKKHNTTPKKEEVDEFARKPRKVFIEMLLDLKDEQNVFTDEEIEDQVETFMFAGHDTMSSTLGFALYELAKHPDIQKKIVEESDAILGPEKNAEITYEAVNDMKYLECCVKECLRLWATVPFIERQLSEEIEIDGITIPPGTVIQPFFFKLHRNEKYFPDPEKFDPDRFTPENSRYRHPYAFLPFSAGPRNCIGLRYAMLAVKTSIVGILRNFEVLPAVPHFEPMLMNNGVLTSYNGIKVQFKLR